MICRTSITLAIGTSLSLPYFYGTAPLVYKAISAKTSSTPLTLTVTAHGLPASWPLVAFTDTEVEKLDASKWPPTDGDWLTATKVDTDTLKFNDVDLARLDPDGNWSLGSIAYQTPVDLAGASARLDIFDGDDVLFSIDGDLDNTTKTITFPFTDADTADLDAGTYTFATFFLDSLDKETILDEGDFILYVAGSPP